MNHQDKTKEDAGNNRKTELSQPAAGEPTGVADIEQEIDLPDDSMPNRNIGKEEWDEDRAQEKKQEGY